MRKNYISIIAGILVLLLLFFGWIFIMKNKVINVDESYNLNVERGMTFYDILGNLEKDSIINSTLWFKVYGKLFGGDMAVQAGYFVLEKDTTYGQLLSLFQYGKSKSRSVTFLEGWSVSDYVDALVSIGYSVTELENCLKTCGFDYAFLTDTIKKNRYEGYLYPDTYEIAEGEIPFSIFNKMLLNFEKKVNSTGLFQRKNYEDLIIIASMLEREVRTREDKRVVAGILQNRLDANMTLGVDATILYALSDWDAKLNTENLDIDSPYNTRKYGGLPPGPISNPSVESIESAINPIGTDFYYYLTATESGQTYFAKTLEEHNRNKERYIK